MKIASLLNRVSALVIALATATVGCGGSDSPGSSASIRGAGGPEGEPEFGGWLVENLSAEPAHLNTHLSTGDASTAYIDSFIFETLIKVDNETLAFIPSVAERWEVSDDHLTYTFYLKENVTFSDGVPLTAHDVKFTYELIIDPKNDTLNIRNYLQDIERVDVIDDYTVRYTMTKPYFRHLLVLGSTEVYPKHIYGKGDFNKHPNNRHPIGSGPYVFESWETGNQIVIARNENYWGEKPLLDKRVFKMISDDNAEFQALENHAVDMIDVPPEKWHRRTNTPKFEREFQKLTPDSPIPGYLSRFNYIGWNMRKPQFSDKRVRKALCMLFDRQLVIDEIWYGHGTIITHGTYHKMAEYNKEIEPLPFDPEGAKKLLTEAGWIDRDRDGIREKNGVNLEFELSYSTGVPEYNQLGAVYQEELRRAGIKMNLNPLEWATFQERVHERTFDACMLAWLTTLMPDPYQLWHSTQAEAGSNYPGLKNAEIDQILEDGRTEFDDEKRIKMYHRFAEIINDEQPYIFLYARPGLIALDARFNGVRQYTAGLDPLEWWVPLSMRRHQ